jgi:HK97 family phage portal protein
VLAPTVRLIGICSHRTAGAAQRPTRVEPLNPNRVTVQLAPDRFGVEYRLDGQPIDRDDLVHFKGYTFPGNPVGLSPVAYAAESIGLALGAQQFGARYFGDAASPSGYLSSEQTITEAQARDALKLWEARHQGRRHTAVLGKGLQFKTIKIAPEESQFLETQRFTVQQIARIYNVGPELIAGGPDGSLTYVNTQERSLDFLRLLPHALDHKLESLLDGLLPVGTFCKFNTGGLLRSTTLLRALATCITSVRFPTRGGPQSRSGKVWAHRTHSFTQGLSRTRARSCT